MRSRTAWRGAAALALATALLLPSGASASSQRVIAHVEANTKTAAKRLPKSFLGFSMEIRDARAYMSISGQRKPNPVVVALTRNITNFGSGVPVLRVGGGSTDQGFFASGHGHPPGTYFAVDFKWIQDVASYLTASGAPFIMGINLAVKDPEAARNMGTAMYRAMPPGSLMALEIGNEPDNYYKTVFYPGKNIRPKNYSPGKYLTELKDYTRALTEAVPQVKLAGPATIAEYKNWLDALPRIVKSAKLDIVTLHRYPLFACGKTPTSRRHVKVSELLAPRALEGQFKPMNRIVQMGRRLGKPVRLSETNSVACGGADKVSNSMASAIWGTDWLFMLAAMGASGVDLHTSSRLYAPFTPMRQQSGRRIVEVHPLYYAMLVFSEAMSHRARLVRSAIAGTRGTKGRFHSWATYDARDRVVRVVLNSKMRKSGYVVVHVPGATGNAKLKRLDAKSITSKRVTWGGQSFARPTTDGQLIGTPRIQTATRRKGSRFRVRMPKYGIALLTVPVRR